MTLILKVPVNPYRHRDNLSRPQLQLLQIKLSKCLKWQPGVLRINKALTRTQLLENYNIHHWRVLYRIMREGEGTVDPHAFTYAHVVHTVTTFKSLLLIPREERPPFPRPYIFTHRDFYVHASSFQIYLTFIDYNPNYQLARDAFLQFIFYVLRYQYSFRGNLHFKTIDYLSYAYAALNQESVQALFPDFLKHIDAHYDFYNARNVESFDGWLHAQVFPDEFLEQDGSDEIQNDEIKFFARRRQNEFDCAEPS